MDIEERRSRKSKLRMKELIIWLIILLIVTIFGVFLHIQHENSFETHSIYMPDVDGLIVGSPVHMMGIPIGYVNKVKIIHDHQIKVRFKITNKDIHIPEGCFATVEFSGLGGSKSLEIYPPSSGKLPNEIVGNNDFIIVDRPKRLRDSMALLYQMYKTLMDMIYTSANFSNEVKQMDNPLPKSGGTTDVNKLIDEADRYINVYDNSMKSVRKTIFKNNK